MSMSSGSWDLFGYGNFMLRYHGRNEIVGATGLFHTFRGFGQGMDDVPEADAAIPRQRVYAPRRGG